VRLVVVHDEVQDAQQYDPDRPVEVEGAGRRRQDPVGVADVRVDVVGRALPRAREQRPRVHQHHRIVVDIHDAAVRCDRLGHLVGVVRGRQPGADVEELPDAGVRGQVPHGPAEELAVGAGGQPQVRHEHEGLLGRLAIGGEVVLPAEQVVPEPGRVSHAGVNLGGRLSVGDRRAVGHGEVLFGYAGKGLPDSSTGGTRSATAD
jgi:hypothetical protein